MKPIQPNSPRASLLARLGRRALEGAGVVCAGARGRYALEAMVEAGAECCVFRGMDVERQTAVAVKLLRDGPGEARLRFERERRFMRRLRHPNIMPALDDGELEGQPFYVMDFAERGSLGRRLESGGPLPPHAALCYLLEVLDALGYAHANGVVHRDVKPDNILVDEDDVARLVDFGVALCLGGSGCDGEEEAASTDGVGTMAYVSPEQLENAGAVGPAADVYGVGATAFALLTGQDPLSLVSRTLRDQALAEVPDPLVEVVDIATRPVAGERYRDASAMAMAMADAMEGLHGP